MSQTVTATVEANHDTVKNCHMVGVKCVDGIHIVKCTHDKSLVGRIVTRDEWDAMPVYKVKSGIPWHALLQDVTTIPGTKP